MALKDFRPECRQVKVDGEVLFSVQAINLETLAVLVQTHFPDLEHVFAILMDGETAGETLPAQMQRISTGMAMRAPSLLANIIAVCSGEELDEALVNTARRLPFPVQVEAMMAIGELTFSEVGGVKKAVESLIVLMATLRMAKARKAVVEPEIPTSQPSTVSTSAFAVT